MKRREEEKRRQDEKLRLEIEEKLKQAEKNGTDVVGAFQLGKLYRDYGDNHNAYLWFSTAATLGKYAVRSNPGDKELGACDRIEFELIYDNPPYDECIGTKISVNGKGIWDILEDIYDSDQDIGAERNAYNNPDFLEYLGPIELYERLTQNLGFIGGFLQYEAMPFWEDGSTVRNILIHYCRGIEDNSSVVVAEKQDEKFVYWDIKEPFSLSFKFAKAQYYYALAKFVKVNLF